MAKTRRRRKDRSERGEDIQRAGKAEHMGGGHYRVGAMRGGKVQRTVWRQGKIERGCDCTDPCMDEWSGLWSHCVHVWAAIADRDAALAAAETTVERARVMHSRGDVHVRDGRDFFLGNGDPYILVEDLHESYRLPLDLSGCQCGEFGETGECAHVLAARLEMADRDEGAA